MGANQSKGQRHDAAEPVSSPGDASSTAATSSFCGCFGSSSAAAAAAHQDTSDDDFQHAPEKQFRISKGQMQPVRRSKMTLLGGRPDSMAAPPARHLSERRANKKRPGSRAKNQQQQQQPHHSQHLTPPVPAVPRPRNMSSDDEDSLLPHNRRLSPMPDFATYSYESMDQLGATPWVAVRQMAERMPSRRSSALAPPQSSSPSASQRTSLAPKQRSSASTDRKTSTSTSASGPRKDSHFSVASTDRKPSTSTSASGQRDDMPMPPPRQTPAQATNMRIRTKFDIPQDVPMPLKSAKSAAESFDTTKVHAPSTRQPSPKLPPPKTFPLKSAMKPSRKSSVASPLSSPKTPQSLAQTPSTVEDAVRELQEIVEAKRGGGGSFDTVRTATTVQSNNWRTSEHVAAVAPGMVVRASTGLLDDIGSALSRPLSESTKLASQLRDEHPSSAATAAAAAAASPRASKKSSATLQKWRMRAASGATLDDASSPRHSGTFFLGGPASRPTSSPTVTTRGSRANSGAESPVDTDWAADGRPFSEASLDAAALRHSLFPTPPSSAPLRGLPSPVVKMPPSQQQQQHQLQPRDQQLRPPRPPMRRSSSIAVANPVSHLSSISGRTTTPSIRSHAADSIASFSFLDGASASSRGGGGGGGGGSTGPPAAAAPEHSAAAVYAARSRPGRGLGLTLRTSGFGNGLGMGPGPATASRDDSSIASGRSGWPASPISTLSPQLQLPIMTLPPPTTPRSPAAALTALPPLAAAPPLPAPHKPAGRALAGVLRGTANTPNSARARRGGGGGGTLGTVGEGAPVRLTAADVVGRQRRQGALADVEREVERIEMERGLARLSQVGVAF